jgi:murein DD-endopeptidase MepM/ murein hydrolase activator NlpD
MAKPEELPDGSAHEPIRSAPEARGGLGLKHRPLPSVDMALLPHERRAARSRHLTLVAIVIAVLVGSAAVSLARPWLSALFTGEPMPPIDELFAAQQPAAGAGAGAATLAAADSHAAAAGVGAAELEQIAPAETAVEPSPALTTTASAESSAVAAAPLGALGQSAWGETTKVTKPFGRARGFRDALINAGASAADADALILGFDKVVDFRRAKPEDQLILEHDTAGNLRSLEYRASATERFRAERKPDGKFAGSRVEVPVEHRRIAVGGYVADSLGRALEGLGLKSSVAGVFIEAFEGKIDFKKHARQGDSFRIIMEEDWVEGVALGSQRVQALQYSGTKSGEALAFWFEPTSGEGDFYDENGRGLHGGWLRTPVRYDHISSPFDLRRRHPILKRIIPHNGIDYAAAPGTTVWAAADGVVTFAGKRGPNGNLIALQHAGGYETYYAHLLRTARGIIRGTHVKQRQPIGAVGSTGRSTGPHLHFALKRSGKFIDPAKQLNGPGKLLPDSQLQRFKRNAAQLKRDLTAIPLAAAPAPIGGPANGGEEFHDDPVVDL